MDRLQEIISSIEIILGHIHEGIVIADPEGRVVYVNEANHRITGMDNEMVLGKHVKEVVPHSSLIEVIETGEKKVGTKTWVGNKFVVSNIVPIFDGNQIIGSISIFMDITQLEELNKKLKQAEEQINHLSKQLSGLIGNDEFVVGKSPISQKTFYTAQKAANVNSNILITGESGTGKEVLSRFIHNNGPRRDKPFIAINCGAIPETLLESELFGYDSGAFTGADKRGKAGIFEQAKGGTIFLDEIGDMPLHLQVKLLRVLQNKEIRRLGSNRKIELDVRVIASTNKNLEKMVDENIFREDLYYRLNVIQINIPPLREREEDIPIYIKFLMEKLSKETGITCPKITQRAMKVIINYHFPGNIRELENILERSMVMDEDGVIDIDDLPEYLGTHSKSHGFYIDGSQGWPTIKEMEKTLFENTLSIFSNKTIAAEVLGISRATLYRKIEEYGIIDINMSQNDT